MVQSGSAQREPSMEEILASIRRIIEDSDSVRPPEDGLPVGAVEAEAARDGEVEAFRAGLDAVSEPLSTPMADIAPSPEAEAGHSAEITPFRSEPPPEPEVSFEEMTAGPAFDEPEEPAADVSAAEPEIAQPVFMSPPETLPAARSSIISEQAGRQVAAAFGELSEAFAASRKRSFDEMAEEILRPMLQDWLDNNLPTLVEKLVREEIERIARGGQG